MGFYDVHHFGGIRVDTRFRPLMIATFPESGITADVITEYLAYNLEWMRAGENLATVTDVGNVLKPPPASVRRVIGEWLKAHADEASQHTVAAAVVVRSSVIRGALTAIYWLKRPDIPHRFVDSETDGIIWCLDSVSEAGVKLPANTAELRSDPTLSTRP